MIGREHVGIGAEELARGVAEVLRGGRHFDGDPQMILDACARHGLEGIVAKRTDAPYRPGTRSRQWLKVKTADWRERHAPMRHER